MMKELPHTHSCFVCGDSNPAGFHLRSATDGNIVRAKFTFSPAHVGFKETVHGGLTATLLDELMTWACAVQTRRFAYCAELNVRYVQPVRPGIEVLASAELVTNRRGKLFEAKSELKSMDGTLLATAAGKYLPLKQTETPAMFTDFVGDVSWLT